MQSFNKCVGLVDAKIFVFYLIFLLLEELSNLRIPHMSMWRRGAIHTRASGTAHTGGEPGKWWGNQGPSNGFVYYICFMNFGYLCLFVDFDYSRVD